MERPWSVFCLKTWPGSKCFQLDTGNYTVVSYEGKIEASISLLRLLSADFCTALKMRTKELLLRFLNPEAVAVKEQA